MIAEQSEISARAKRYLRLLVETYYDVQAVRKATEQRILSVSEAEGLAAVVGEEEHERLQSAGTEKYKAAIRKHKKDDAFVAAALAARKEMEGNEKHDKINWHASRQEALLKNQAMKEISEHPLWTEWLQYVRGIGPCLAGGLLARIKIERCDHASQLWKYAGLAVITTSWKCLVCSHAIDHKPGLGTQGSEVKCPKCSNKMEPIGHADRRAKGQKVGYNPKVKVLAWKISESFIRFKPEKSGYRRLYDQFRREINAKIEANKGFCSKEHLDEKKKVIPCFDMHKKEMALRKVKKVFFAHVYYQWRTFLGLPTSDPFIFWAGHDRSSYIEPIYDKPKGGESVSES